MPAEGISPQGLQRYRRWLAVQRAKGNEPSEAEMSAFLKAEVEAGVSGAQKSRALNIEQQRTNILQERTDILKKGYEAEADAAKIAGIGQLAEAGLAVNELTGGFLGKTAGKAASTAVGGIAKAFSASKTAPAAKTTFEAFHTPSVYSGSSSEKSLADYGKAIFSSIFETPSGDTVLCTVLHEKGIMPDDIYDADVKYGNMLSYEVMVGYHVWAVPVANLMRRSDLMTKLVAKPIMLWAKHIAGRRNIFGYLCEIIGIPICRFIGRNKTIPATEK